jgi:hypothetical protein
MTNTGKENIHEAALIIASELLMDENEADKIVHFDEYEAVKNFLAVRIKYLLEFDPEKMKNILYRIDVSEQKVLEALADNSINDAVLIISDLILQREIQKTITRKQYASQAVDPDLAL